MRVFTLGLAAVLASTAAPALAQVRADGEYSRTAPARALTWKQAAHRVPAAQLRYREVAPRRMLEVQRSNGNARLKSITRVGFARKAAIEALTRGAPVLRWVPVAGGAVARLEVRSPDALALRVGLDVRRMDPRIELRFAGSDDTARVVAMTTVAEAQARPGDDGLYWSPSTDGEAQIIELFRPHGVPASRAVLAAPTLSHLLASSRNDFKLLEKLGNSGACNVDAVCRVNELGTHYVNAKNAVARMQYVKGGGTYLCTGTLLADTTPGTQVPYFFTANHCFADGAPVPASMQTVANTLNTFWSYERTGCGSGSLGNYTQLAGGATYLYSDASTDGMLLRLNNPAPAGAYFAAWNAGPVAQSAAVMAIHHPGGDYKKSSIGQHVRNDPSLIRVGWTSGTTEGGSSGSGLFVRSPRNVLELRGGLYGGAASCANTGSIANNGNWDEYSRLDVLFPNIRQYLAADDVLENGGDPLLPPQAAASSASASAPAAAPATPPAVRPAVRPVTLRDAIRDLHRRRALVR